MNKDVFEVTWKPMRGRFKEWWGNLTDDDLDRVAGNFDQFMDLLQEKHDLTRPRGEEKFDRRLVLLRAQRVEEEFRRRMARIEARQKDFVAPQS